MLFRSVGTFWPASARTGITTACLAFSLSQLRGSSPSGQWARSWTKTGSSFAHASSNGQVQAGAGAREELPEVSIAVEPEETERCEGFEEAVWVESEMRSRRTSGGANGWPSGTPRLA